MSDSDKECVTVTPLKGNYISVWVSFLSVLSIDEIHLFYIASLTLERSYPYVETEILILQQHLQSFRGWPYSMLAVNYMASVLRQDIKIFLNKTHFGSVQKEFLHLSKECLRAIQESLMIT